jgi:hypothetical protein
MAIDTGVQSQIQEHYDSDIYKILFEDGKLTSPLLAMAEVKAMKEGLGRGYVVRVATSEGAAISADPEIADDITGDGLTGGRPGRERWVVSPVSLDAPFSFSRDEILAIEGMSADEQFDVITDEMDMAVSRMRNLLAEQVSGKGWGCLAQTTAQSTTTFTVNPAYVNRFPVGARLVASITEDTDVLLGTPAGKQVYVTAVNPSTGVVTCSEDMASVWASDQDLFIFRAGNRIATDPSAADTAKVCITGLEGWVNPANTSLFGVTTTGNPALTGFDVATTGMDTGRGLIAMANQLFSYGRKADTILVSGKSWELLQANYDAAKTVAVQLGDYKIGFAGFKLPTVFGDCTVIPDPFIKPGHAFAGPFQNKQWRPRLLHSGAKLVNLDNFDGKDFERQNSGGARTFKGQFFFRGNFVLPGPGMYAFTNDLPTS